MWTPIVNEEFFAEAVASNFFLDVSQYSNGNDIFHIPNAFGNAFSVQTQSTQATEVTTDAPLSVDDTLTVNNHVYIATLLGYMDQVQIGRQYSLSEVYGKKAAGTLLEDLEGDLFALYSNVSTNTVNDTASVVADVDIRGAVEDLDTADVPLDECAFFFHPLRLADVKSFLIDLETSILANIEMTGAKAKATLNDLTKRLLNWRCESLNSMAT